MLEDHFTEDEVPEQSSEAEHSWKRFAGMFEEEPLFDEVLEEIEAYRREVDAADFTAAEAEALVRGGLDLSPRSNEEESPLARTTARYAALLGTSLTTAEAAARLGVERSRIRQHLAKGSLYGIRSPQGWRLPAFQFLEEGSLPGVGEVVSALRQDLHPLAVHNFFTLPNVDLHASDLDRDLSPREWLQVGYPPQAVVELAGHLE